MKRIALLGHCSCNGGRCGRLPGPRIWTGRWKGLPDLRRHNSGRVRRPEFDLREPPGSRQPKPIRVQLGNDIAMKAYREGKLPFPDGAIIAALHWNYVPSEESNKVLARAGAQSSVAGSAVNIQFMVKDSIKYAATGGWGFADFTDGKPGSEALQKTCFPCHQPAKDHDLVYAHYAP
jgi:hypothetical protein